MTDLYSDAELAAVAAVRLALDDEDDARGPSAGIADIVRRLEERHPGEPAALAVTTALARYSASSLAVIADHWGRPIGEVLDEFELSRLDNPDDSA